MDSDNNGALDLNEFRCMSVLLCQDVALRLTTQQVVKLFLAPFLGAVLVEIGVTLLADIDLKAVQKSRVAQNAKKSTAKKTPKRKR